MSALLKLVQPQPFHHDLEVDLSSSGNAAHSLHGAFSYLAPWQPQLVRYLLQRFSQKNDLVLDPCCGAGGVGLECLISDRRFLGCASEHSLIRLAQARLTPAEFPDLVLRLQMIRWRQPIDVRGFQDPLPLFFDVDTYCELMNLRAALRPTQSAADRFIQFVVAAILHGNSVGHLSVFTSQHAALSPQAQARLNRERNQVPSFRAVNSRVVKQAAELLRDGIPSVLMRNSENLRLVCADARNITPAATGSVDLALVAPEQPGLIHHGLRSWLRAWWLGLELPVEPTQIANIEEWQDYLNEVLMELARVVARGGRAVLRMGEGRIGGKRVNYAEALKTVVQSCLAPYWAVEGTIVERHINAAGVLKGLSKVPSNGGSELLVLRRRS